MLHAIFTLDYEIHGTGEGCPYKLMVEPTNRLMDLFDAYGGRLTIMADVAEIIKFGEYKKRTGRDDFFYEAITTQLQKAIRRGHDVQLHLHSSYFNARYDRGSWAQDWSEYNIAELPYDRINELLSISKTTLETLLEPIDPEYKCFAFRAANWAMHPSENIVQALVNNGFTIDTSVFKYGQRTGLVNFDYCVTPSALKPWPIDISNICNQNDSGELLEFPIYSESRWIGAFLTPQRIYRAWMSGAHRQTQNNSDTRACSSRKMETTRKYFKFSNWLRSHHAWKADFNQCTGRQLIHAIERAERLYTHSAEDLPFVLIGHSKLFSSFNENSIKPLLSFLSLNPSRFGFASFRSHYSHGKTSLARLQAKV